MATCPLLGHPGRGPVATMGGGCQRATGFPDCKISPICFVSPSLRGYPVGREGEGRGNLEFGGVSNPPPPPGAGPPMRAVGEETCQRLPRSRGRQASREFGRTPRTEHGAAGGTVALRLTKEEGEKKEKKNSNNSMVLEQPDGDTGPWREPERAHDRGASATTPAESRSPPKSLARWQLTESGKGEVQSKHARQAHQARA